MDPRFFDAIAEARDEAELLIALEKLAHELDFERFTLGVRIQPAPGSRPLIRALSNPPEAFKKLHFSPELTLRDPVFNHVSHHTRPLVYDQQMYVAAQAEEMWECQAPHGYAVGIAAAAAFGRDGPRLLFGVDRSAKLPGDPARTAYLISQIATVLIYAQGQLDKILGQSGSVATGLTAQQWNILRLIAEGKSDGVIAEIIGISTHTVNYHCRNIFKALNISTRLQAVQFANSLSMFGLRLP